jgi:exonuclease SbcC
MATQTAKATELESARAEVLAVQGQLAQSTGAFARAETELAARAKYDRLADEWPRWQAAIGRGRSALAQLGAVPLSALAAAEQHATTAHATAVTSLAQAEGALTTAQTEAAEADTKLVALEPEKVRHERAELQARKPRVLELGAALGEVLRFSKEAAKARTQEVAAKEKAAAETEAEAEAEQARELAQAKLETAEAKLARAEAVRDLDSYRTLLAEECPCPLCGSKDHPYGRRAPKVDERLVKAEEEVAVCGKEVKVHERAVATHRTKAETAAESAKQHATAAKELETDLRAETKRYGVARKACPEAELPTDPTEAGTTAALNKHQRVLEELLAASLATEKAVVGLEKRAKGARELRDQRQVALEAIRKGVEAAKGTLEAAVRRHEEARSAHANAATALDAAVEELSPAFDEIGPFRAALERDAKAFEASCAAQIVEQKRLREERTRLAVAIEQAKPKEAEATTRLSERTEAHKAAQELAVAKKSELDALAATRHTVLDGRSVSEVLEALQKGLGQARAAHEQATTSHQQASVRHAEVTTLFAKAREAVAEREGELAAAQTALAAALGPRSLADVRVLLAHDAAWMDSRRARREASRAAVERAATILAEREEQHGKHLASGAPALASETLTESLATAKTAVEDAEKGRQSLQLRLHDDDEAHARRGAKAVELERQRQRTEFREKLSEVIGSADGKKLRVFAQNLTFGALLEEANHHLRQLSHRYSLAPAAQGDLEFQIIDHDMADEVRSSSTLSGGESFLVSLALALGLSSLGASKTRVESLFIDEGFGTLDGRSLDAALASLEALQATGRQIGIISHVERLAAKISARVNVKRSGMRSVVSVEEG